MKLFASRVQEGPGLTEVEGDARETRKKAGGRADKNPVCMGASLDGHIGKHGDLLKGTKARYGNEYRGHWQEPLARGGCKAESPRPGIPSESKTSMSLGKSRGCVRRCPENAPSSTAEIFLNQAKDSGTEKQSCFEF